MAFGSNIIIANGFDLGKQAPVDSRYLCATITERDEHVTGNRAYEGMQVYVTETHTLYKYTSSGTWEELGGAKTTTIAIGEGSDVTGASIQVGGGDTQTLTLTLKDVVTAGTGTKITVNSKGLVTGVANLSTEDLPEITADDVTGLGTAAKLNAGTANGNVVVVGSDGKIDPNLMPALAITSVHVVASEEEMLGLTAQEGDVCVRSDEEKSYILKQSPASTLANWIELDSPTDKVQSVNGKTGTVVLNTDDIAEGSTNQYYTETRATGNFNTNIALTNSTSLADGDTLFHTDDNLPATQVTTDDDHQFVSQTQLDRLDATVSIVVGSTPDTALASLKNGDFYYEVSEDTHVTA